jgi:hypothetical protein
MRKFHVTINRQFGSLGRPIAQRMAEQLNVEFYDRDIIEIAASQTGLPLKRASDIEESASKNQFLRCAFRWESDPGMNGIHCFKHNGKSC